MNFRCQECGWIGPESALKTLSFKDEECNDILVCPACQTIENTLAGVCDEPGCRQVASCGTPTPEGYRRTCFAHTPAAMDAKLASR